MANEFLKMDKSRIYALIISLVIFIFIALVYSQLTLLDGLENNSVDFKFYIRAPEQKSEKIKQGVSIIKRNPLAREDIIILGIDENTIRAFNEIGINWPFPWNVHEKFTRFVGSGKPLALLFDVMFLDHKEHENEFAAAVKDAGNVFIDYPFEVTEYDRKYVDHEERMKILNTLRFDLDPDDVYEEWINEAVPPVPVLAEAALGVGFANVRTDPDHINRKMPLIIKYNGHYYPSVDLLVVMHYFGISGNDIEIKIGDYIKLKNLPVEKMAKPNKARTIEIPVDEQGFMDINFVGGFGSYNYYPYHYFYQDGVFDNPSLQNKILLVAAFATTGIATDIHKSPYGEMFGIEHKANALNTVLNQNFILKLKTWQNVFILFMIAVILGFFLPRISIIKSILLTGALVLLYFVGSQVFFETINLITATATPVIQIGLTFTIIIAYRVITEQKEKRFIRQTFSKLVAKSIVDELLQDPEKLKLGGDKKILTVLFSDIRGFTTLSEKMTPEGLVEHLNEYLEAMTNIVIKYEGTLDKYVGDEIMAFWGAPVPQEEHALLACKAAVEMMDVLHRLNEKWTSLPEPKPALDIGIGLNTGDMVVALMGSSSRMDYTLMGDNVNLGARLEGTNKQYRTNIIISEFTYEQVKDFVTARELDLVRVKGKELPVKIYELIDVKL
ncbi:MAG: adenylate/guanylate cyclase domain-containing protein [Spirochaetes bacterium]|nr:adenylate/guanylate cyclase domain-containing protein [Spirochaetota bacterium]